MPEPTFIDWAQLAAYIDGEGCIIISRAKPNSRQRNPQYQLVVSVYNTDPRLAVWLKERFGGFIYVSKPKGNRKPRYTWQVTSLRAEEILRGCYSYFILKREQAEVGLQFRALKVYRRWSATPPTMVLQRETLKQKLHQLHAQEVVQ